MSDVFGKAKIDVFRKEYKQLSQVRKDMMLTFKERAEDLLNEFESAFDKDHTIEYRMIELAKAKLEESIMWAIKAIT